MAGVQLLQDLGVISINLSGTIHVQQRVDAFEAMLELQSRTACRRVLVDLSQAVVVDGSHVETLDHAARLARSPVMRGMRIAYIGEIGSATSVESLAALRGYFYQRFRSRASALRWLCGEAALPFAA